PRTTEVVQERISRLKGKICIIKVGGATPLDADYMKLRVDDAICAVRSAMRSGVLPGGGVAFVNVRDSAGEFADAFSKPFLQLFNNAGLNAERLLGAVESGKPWLGFDLKNPSEKPEDLLKLGIIDPLEVLKEVVTNAATTAAKLISCKAIIIDESEDKDAPTSPMLG